MWRDFGREFLNAFWEWLVGVGIAALPLIMHGVVVVAFRNGEDHSTGWTGDVLFLVIAMAGNSAAQTVFRMEGSLKPYNAGRALGAAVFFSIVIMAVAALLYGAYAAGQLIDASSLRIAWMMLAASVVSTLMTEVVVAHRLAVGAVIAPRSAVRR